jgi:hypothetical protein
VCLHPAAAGSRECAEAGDVAGVEGYLLERGGNLRFAGTHFCQRCLFGHDCVCVFAGALFGCVRVCVSCTCVSVCFPCSFVCFSLCFEQQELLNDETQTLDKLTGSVDVLIGELRGDRGRCVLCLGGGARLPGLRSTCCNGAWRVPLRRALCMSRLQMKELQTVSEYFDKGRATTLSESGNPRAGCAGDAAYILDARLVRSSVCIACAVFAARRAGQRARLDRLKKAARLLTFPPCLPEALNALQTLGILDSRDGHVRELISISDRLAALSEITLGDVEELLGQLEEHLCGLEVPQLELLSEMARSKQVRGRGLALRVPCPFFPFPCPWVWKMVPGCVFFLRPSVYAPQVFLFISAEGVCGSIHSPPFELARTQWCLCGMGWLSF